VQRGVLEGGEDLLFVNSIFSSNYSTIILIDFGVWRILFLPKLLLVAESESIRLQIRVIQGDTCREAL
jgi:hypothetical protein